MVHPQDTLAILDALKQLGFGNDAFRELHHRHREKRGETTKWGETIAVFEGYSKTLVGPYEDGGTNEHVHKRLEFVLNTYRGWKLPPSQKAVFVALAKAAWLGIQPPQG
jgi:hypothetical protein